MSAREVTVVLLLSNSFVPSILSHQVLLVGVQEDYSRQGLWTGV